jgi:hypothetical protein
MISDPRGAMARWLAAALMLAWVSPASAMECRDDPAVVAACFTVHGRLAIAAGGEIQIWPSGTNRLLQLTYPADLPQSLTSWPYISPRLEKLLRAGEADVWGDFEICPLTYDIPGQRRLICIQTGTRLGVVDNPRRGQFADQPKASP